VEALCKGAAELGEMRGALLFQLPPNFKADAARLTDFLAVLKASGAGEVAFEFRHETWYTPQIEQVLADGGAALCVAESEDLAAHRAATASYGYLRLRNEDYDAKALDDWARWIGKQRWTHADVYFKHEDTARGTKFAAELRKRLG
jgi:uncharacterized protein YecE (DUF72 family)